ncbi:MAG: serine hydrolase [Eubacteriales bacterium]|nr:serine hydrolase [Eubacteriales bacterium]
MPMNMETIWNTWQDALSFSGVFSARDTQGIVCEKCRGFRNRSEKLSNNADTAFGIASGTKLFTGLAICKLMDAGKLSLEDKLWALLPYDLGRINKNVTLRQLLTHTSGIGDYIDEENPDVMEQLKALYHRYPVYLWEHLAYYLPMITPLPQKFEPGARFSYSNAGYVMLGLVVEAVSGTSYQQFVQNEIILPLQLAHTGFYRTDCLPGNTACGYTGDPACRTNIYSLPIVGGSDGGLYTCAGDLDTLWRALFAGRILSKKMLQAFLSPQVARGDGKSYGLGVYRMDRHENTAYYALGSDFGIDFFTAYFPRRQLTVSTLGNTEVNTYPLLDALFAELLG